ncbi:MAG: DNA polymerase I [Gammaproteobacteria bacterium]|nr:DNA polymerase I [Gammaproteobacteria bacterium]
MTKPLILVDGSSYLYRAFYALPPLINSKGQPTGAIYGVINMLKKLISDFEPDNIAIIFDAKGKSFRHAIYPNYKANRVAMPQELRSQIEPLHEAIKAMGLPILSIENIEADDVIATLTKNAKAKNKRVLISTGDKDMAQLVDRDVNLINTMTNVVLDTDGVYDKFGVKPNQIRDYLALTGDNSDNIPGVPKIGPKTAAKLLQEFGSIKSIVENKEKIAGKVGENLRNNLDQLDLAFKLVTLKSDVELNTTIDQLIQTEPNIEKLSKIYQELEFKRWFSELLDQKKSLKKTYTTIFTKEDLEHYLKKIKHQTTFAFDLETTSLNTIDAEIVGIALATNENDAIYIPIGHDYQNAPAQLTLHYVLEKLKPILENKEIKKLGQNLKYDMEVLLNYQITLQGIAYDSMLESYLLNSTTDRHDLDSLALKYLGLKTVTFNEIAGSGKKQLTFNQINIEEASQYAAEDADVALRLHNKMWQLILDNNLKNLFNTIEIPLITVLAKMEHRGVKIDQQKLQQQSKELAKKTDALQQEAYILAGEEFNLSSPKQLQEILFKKLKLPISKKTPKGQPSTAESVLQNLSLDYPLPKLILEFRSLSKLKSTYTDSLPKQINRKTLRVHTSYNQAVTATGRLSSTNPNLQNIPVRTEEGRKIRQAFVTEPNHLIISADYSQIELRIMAHISQDENLINAFKNNLDIHTSTASELLAIDPANVSKEERRRAKAINFGIIYGISAFGLAKQINCSNSEAQKYIDNYFNRYPKVYEYMQAMKSTAHKNGFVETIFGRRIYVPEINSSNYMRQQAAERAAINAPMQGTAADIIKLAMINIDNAIEKSTLDLNMIMQVHDELVFEVKANELKAAIDLIQNHMVNVTKLSIPLLVDIGYGNNWDEAH